MPKKRTPKKAQERMRLMECAMRVEETMKAYPELSIVFAARGSSNAMRHFGGNHMDLLGLCQFLLEEIERYRGNAEGL